MVKSTPMISDQIDKQLQLLQDGTTQNIDLQSNLDAISEQLSLGDDSDSEENYNDDTLAEKGWVADGAKPFQQTQEFGVNNGLVLPTVEPPEFGDVCIKNSNNVHLGNKTFYKGPVTIKQFVYSNPSVHPATVDDINCGNNITEKDAKTHDVNDKLHFTDITANSSKYVSKKKWSRTWKISIFACAITLIILTTTVLLVLLSTKNWNIEQSYKDKEYNENTIVGPVSVDGVKFVSRIQWGAQPQNPIDNLTLPVPYVIISHTATEICKTQAQCVMIVRIAQTFHMSSLGWGDIGYNFLIGGDGFVYVGRAWDKEGAHTFSYNKKSIGIAFIGTFIDKKPTVQQLEAAQNLINLGVKRGKIAPDYKLLAHCQVIATESPGAALYAILKTWSHWSYTI